MRALPLVLASALTLAIAGCGSRDPVADNAAAVNLPAPANDTAPDPAALPPPKNNEPANAPAPPATGDSTAAIPADLQGRWGLTPGDCTTKRGDAKGLLVVTADALHFYESKAIPSTNVETAAGAINGNFQFTGEGQTWTKFESLKRSADKLTRTETNPAASYTYAKC